MSDVDKMKRTRTSGIFGVALRVGFGLGRGRFGLASAFMHFHLPQTFGAFALSAIAITFWYAALHRHICRVLSSVVRDFLFDPHTSPNRGFYSILCSWSLLYS